MKIGIIGSGPSALYSALLLSKKHPGASISIYEKETKLAKKLRCTGNGKANILPAGIVIKDNPGAYNDPIAMNALFVRFPASQRLFFFDDFGIPLIYVEGAGYYPFSRSAPLYADYLIEILESKGVSFHLNAKVIDYIKEPDSIDVLFQNGSREAVDHLIIAPGAASGKNLGSDGNFVDVLRKHGYVLSPYRPGLCPMKVNDRDVAPLAGLRFKCVLSVYENGERIFSESGEVLYKKDGISGIVAMNASSAIIRSPRHSDSIRLSLDLFPDKSIGELREFLRKLSSTSPYFLDSLFPRAFSEHLAKRAKRFQDVDYASSLANVLKGLSYSYASNYGFEESQVSVGGLSLDEANADFESKKEPRVHFAGELLDIDGVCGGYNLQFDLLNAMAIAESL